MQALRIVLVVCSCATAVFVAPSVAYAGGCMGCVSSHACDTSSVRGECFTGCVGTECACSDEDCRVSQVAPDFQQRGTTYEGPGRAVAVGIQTYVITSCQGDVRGVTYTRQRARKVEAAMVTVALRPVDVGVLAGAEIAMERFKSPAYVVFPAGVN